MIEDFKPNEILYEKSKYRTKFEIHFAEWNPKIELLALASTRGNVIVKRLYWKTGWKIDFGKQNYLNRWRSLFSDSPHFKPISLTESHFKTATTNESSLDGICWSPDGQILLLTFQNGHFYFLNTQNGKSVYFINFEHSVKRVKWFEVIPAKDIILNENLPIKLSSSDFNFMEDGLTEQNQLISDIEQFFKILPDSLFGTLLLVLYSGSIPGREEESCLIDVLACGIITVARFDVTEALVQLFAGNENKVFLSTLEVTDIQMAKNDGKFMVVCKYCVKKDLQENSSNENSLSFEYETSVFNFSFDFTVKKMKIYSNITWKVCQMSYCMMYISEMINYCTFDWAIQSEAFHRRLFYNMKSDQKCVKNLDEWTEENYFSLCRDIFTVITTGILPKSIQNFIVNDSALKDLKLANNFIDTHFSSFLKAIMCFIKPALQLLKLHLNSLTKIFETVVLSEAKVGNDKNVFCSALLSGIGSHGKKSMKAKIYYDKFKKFRLSLILLEEFFICLSDVIEENRKFFKHFIRFLILLCSTQNDEFNNEADDLIKTLDIQKIDLRTLAIIISNKFNFKNQNQLLKFKDNFDLEKKNFYQCQLEFEFLQAYFDRLKIDDKYSNKSKNNTNLNESLENLDKKTENLKKKINSSTIYFKKCFLDDVFITFSIQNSQQLSSQFISQLKKTNTSLLNFLQLTDTVSESEPIESKLNNSELIEYSITDLLNDCAKKYNNLLKNSIYDFV